MSTVADLSVIQSEAIRRERAKSRTMEDHLDHWKSKQVKTTKRIVDAKKYAHAMATIRRLQWPDNWKMPLEKEVIPYLSFIEGCFAARGVNECMPIDGEAAEKLLGRLARMSAWFYETVQGNGKYGMDYDFQSFDALRTVIKNLSQGFIFFVRLEKSWRYWNGRSEGYRHAVSLRMVRTKEDAEKLCKEMSYEGWH